MYCIKHQELKPLERLLQHNTDIYTLPVFQVREVESGQVVYSESDSMDVPIVTTTCEGQLLVVFYDGSHLVKVHSSKRQTVW